MTWFENASVSELATAGFILGCVVLTLIFFSVRRLDVSRFADHEDARLTRGSFFEYPSHALLILIFGLVGLIGLAFVGWRIPEEIERIYGAGGAFRLFNPDVTMPTLGRAAQVVGAVCFALMALRLLRPAVFLGLLALLGGLGVFAFAYVFPG